MPKFLVACLVSAVCASAEKAFLDPHSDMAAMMADDGMDDDSDDNAMGLLQTGAGAKNGANSETAAYEKESAAALTSQLGPRWNGAELDRDAKAKTAVLLKGIAGDKAVSSLKKLMGVMGALR